jgi:WD40 repeat protein
MKQRIVLLVGLTAVSLLILFTSCTQPTTLTTLEATSLPTVMPTANPSPQVTPSPQRLSAPTVTADNLPTVTAVPTVQVYRQCTESEPKPVDDPSLLRGMMLSGRWEGGPGLAILGNDDVAPVTIYYYTDHLLRGVSPDGKWIATSLLTDIIDRDSNTYTVEVIVTDFASEKSFQTSYEAVSLSFFDKLNWANNSQLVLPLKNQDELFQWLVWTPFTDEQELLSVELTGIENAMAFYQVAPAYDPRLELVVYPCELCGSTAYIVKNIKTSETEWTINFDPKPSYAYRGPPVWSPNGEYVAVGGGNNLLNRLKIVDRDGVVVYDLALPDGGVATAERLVWSPNSEYLAFSRANPNPAEPYGYNSTLAYVKLRDGAVIDLCVDLPITAIKWSPDNTKIAFGQWREEKDTNVFSIIDINTGDVFQWHNPDIYQIVDWIILMELEE